MDVNRSVDRRIQRFRIRTIDDRQIEVLLLLLSLLLMAMPVVILGYWEPGEHSIVGSDENKQVGSELEFVC